MFTYLTASCIYITPGSGTNTLYTRVLTTLAMTGSVEPSGRILPEPEVPADRSL
jgi:hypothetical protein